LFEDKTLLADIVYFIVKIKNSRRSCLGTNKERKQRRDRALQFFKHTRPMKQPRLQTEVWHCLLARFIVNLPSQEIEDPNRVMYHMQQAYWFFCDYHLPPNETMSFRLFVRHLGQHLGWTASTARAHCQNFQVYERQTPRCGGVLFNDKATHVLLVKSFNGGFWGFPVGKMDFGESKQECARREIFEEINFAATITGKPTTIVSDQRTYHLFCVVDVPSTYQFSTQTIKEIDQIAWVPIDRVQHFLPPEFVNIVFAIKP
jgi:mRNA-decapping enzyme subunit 2